MKEYCFGKYVIAGPKLTKALGNATPALSLKRSQHFLFAEKAVLQIRTQKERRTGLLCILFHLEEANPNSTTVGPDLKPSKINRNFSIGPRRLLIRLIGQSLTYNFPSKK